MDNKDLTEKFVEGSISDQECEALFSELNHNSELTDELQQNLYMDELLEQSFVEEKSAENFILNLTGKLKEEGRHKKQRTGKFNKITTGRQRRPAPKIKKKRSSSPVLVFSAVAALFAMVLTVIVLKSQSSSNSIELSSNLYIQDISGSVTLHRDGKTSALKDGDFLLKGDTVSTSAGSSGSLLFISEKTEISLNPESRFTIESSIKKEEKNKIFQVEKGRVEFDVAHQDKGSSFLIKSSKADSKVIGTRLEVTSETGSSSVKVFEGIVRVLSRTTGDMIDVPGNHYVNISDDSFPNVQSISGKRPQVLGFSLVDAKSDKVVEGFEAIKDGVILDKKSIPEFISVRINTSNYELISKVEAELKNAAGKTVFPKKVERVLPYTMTGDTIAGDYKEWEAPPGEYLLEVNVYNHSNVKTDTSSLTFTIQ